MRIIRLGDGRESGEHLVRVRRQLRHLSEAEAAAIDALERGNVDAVETLKEIHRAKGRILGVN